MQGSVLAEFEELGITTDPVWLRNFVRRMERIKAQREARRIEREKNPPRRLNPNPWFKGEPLGLEDIQKELSHRLLLIGSA